MDNKITQFDSIVVDIDDTISITTNRDFANATPILPVIEKLRLLHEMGHPIILHTARGQNSCKGKLKTIRKRNLTQIEEWLKNHNVPYDELVFGKPLGCIYLDDKAVTIDTFLAEKNLSRMVNKNINHFVPGGSGGKIIKTKNSVQKYCDNPQGQVRWLEYASRIGICNTVEVIEGNDEWYRMKRLEGKSLYFSRDIDDFLQVMDIIDEFSQVNPISNVGVKTYLEKVEKRAMENLPSSVWSKYVDYQDRMSERLEDYGSFSHDDLTAGNVIVTEEDGLFLIDPNNYGDVWTSWLLDVAKLNMSVKHGYERFILGLPKNPSLKSVAEVVKYRYMRYKPELDFLELTCMIRLLGYQHQEGKRELIINNIKEVLNEL